VHSYEDCGIYSCGFARARCPDCAAEYFIAFSCQTRYFCPSCGAKRAAIFGAYLADEVLAEVGHAQWVFTIPKMLRPYFLHHRELLGRLCQAAWETVAELVDAAAGDGVQIRPGMVAVLQTARSDLAFSPHIHALATRGGWTHDGRWVPVPFVDTDAAEKLFQHKVISFLQDEDLLTEERTELLLSWRRTGFSVHNSVTAQPDDCQGLERLARYLVRPPVSLERLELDRESEQATYRVKRCVHDGFVQTEQVQRFDPRELLARVLIHVPEPRFKLIRYLGEYAGAAKARRQRDDHLLQHGRSVTPAEHHDDLADDVETGWSAAQRRAARRQWASLIRRI